MKRYEKIVLESERGITFEVSNGANGELVISAMYVTDIGNYEKPPIPNGYSYVDGDWKNGFVISRDSDKSEFVWVPVDFLNANGTMDGKLFTEKFGRRSYMGESFTIESFNESLTNELSEQVKSIKEYGGFYVSRYNISIDSNHKLRSVKDAMPYVTDKYLLVKALAKDFENTEEVKSHLMYGAEYDSIIEWITKSGAKEWDKVIWDSTDLGNHSSMDIASMQIEKTGSSEAWKINNLYDFVGNVAEWTQEKSGALHNVVRGGQFDRAGYTYPTVSRRIFDKSKEKNNAIGFHVVLCIK